ncbi:MAG: alkaline phosphatase family protein [Pseudomonadota bacterium]|nr:alkaline phosphatase family protein [Pseudomonadota bacterium]
MRQVGQVIVVVFDGLRPDRITPDTMPSLSAFLGESAWFRQARTVFPSYTRVCTSALATGAWPRDHGVVGNAFHQPRVLTGRPLDTSRRGDLEALAEADGAVLTAPDLGGALAASGRRMVVAHCGSSGSAFLVNADVADHDGHWTFSIHGEDHTRTPGAVAASVARHGPLPEPAIPRFNAIARAEAVIRDLGLPEAPDVALVWFPEPDTTFHYRRIGSPEAAEALAACDEAFAAIRAAAPADALIVAMSDHGQITVDREIDIEGELRAAGFRAGVLPRPEDDFGITRGASGEIRALRPAAPVAELAAWLMAQDWMGMVFAREALPGTLPVSLVAGDHARAPDLHYVCRSGDGPDEFGFEGLGLYTGGIPVGGGMHGGLHRRELNTLLALGGPGVAPAVHDCPAGIVDVSPTILAALGEAAPFGEGRVLVEAWGEAPETAETLTDEAETAGFRQRLTRIRYRGKVYLTEGGRI